MAGGTPSIVLIAGSAGAIESLTTILGALPADFSAMIVVVQHRAPDSPSMLASILARRTALHVTEAREHEMLQPGTVYVASPTLHLTVTEAGRFAYRDGARIRHVLSSANPLFISVAECFGPRTIGVVLSGSGRDGTDGVQTIKARGGIVIAQDERTSAHFGMPGSAIETGAVDYVTPVDQIAPLLVKLIGAEATGA